MSRERDGMRYEKSERNIRRVFYHYDDGTDEGINEAAGYEVRVGGKRMGTLPNITQARKVRDKAQSDHGRGVLVAPSAGRRLLRDVVEAWLKGPQVVQAKPLTTASYERLARVRLKPLHAHPVNTINKETVKTFVAGLTREGLAPATVGHVLFVLKCVMEDAVDSGYIASNPCVGVKKPAAKKKPLNILGHAQVDAIVTATPVPWDLLVLLAAHSGLRAGELAGLRVRHFNPLKRSVTVSETIYDNIKHDGPGRPKSDAGYRTVDELPKDLVDRLATQVDGWPADAYLFGGNGETYTNEGFAFGPSEKPYSHNRFYRQVFLPTVRGLGLSARFHDLRHYHASALLDAGLPIVYIAKRLGHADPTLLLRTYGHPLEGQGVGLADLLAAQRAASAEQAAKVRKIG